MLTFVNDYLSISRHFFKFYYNTDIIKGVQKIDINEKILKTAEKMIREGGYNSFSFREIAVTVGIKSSSVHYHFQTKAHLGAAVARYYTDRFLESLGNPEDSKDPVKTFVHAFEKVLLQDQGMCLCGLLGAEINGLPSKVINETKLFFERTTEWLTRAYDVNRNKKESRTKAIQTLAILEGAMIMCTVLRDNETFYQAEKLIATYK